MTKIYQIYLIDRTWDSGESLRFTFSNKEKAEKILSILNESHSDKYSYFSLKECEMDKDEA